MLKKVLISGVIVFAQLFSAYSMSKQDSIYLDMSRFLIQKGDMPKEMEAYGVKSIFVYEIVSQVRVTDFIDIPFGVFEFHFAGCMGCGSFVLIKHNDTYRIVNPLNHNFPIIIRLLLEIMDENPELISNEQFEAYMRAIANIEIIGHERSMWIKDIGRLEYVFF